MDHRNAGVWDAVKATAGTFTPLAQAHTNADGTEDGVVITIALKPAAVAAEVFVPTLPMNSYRMSGRYV